MKTFPLAAAHNDYSFWLLASEQLRSADAGLISLLKGLTDSIKAW